MPRTPVAPPPDTIDPHCPQEAPGVACPREQPAPGSPEYAPPADPVYTPDPALPEAPAPDLNM